MPRAYSQDLRWRAIWLTEILGFQIDEVSMLLQMSTKTISRYVRTFRMLGHVDTAVIGRPYACVRGNAPARGARYHGGFAAAPRENAI